MIITNLTELEPRQTSVNKLISPQLININLIHKINKYSLYNNFLITKQKYTQRMFTSIESLRQPPFFLGWRFQCCKGNITEYMTLTMA